MESINFAATIYRLRNEKGLTQEELADKLHLTRSAIGMYEQGRRTPKMEDLALFADFFGVDMNTLLTGHPATTLTEKELPPEPLVVRIPVLGQIRAGEPIEMIQDVQGYEEISLEMASHGDFFALRAVGDSMLPHIADGDILIIRQTPYVDNGKVAIVAINGDEATCKKFCVKDKGVMLIAYNKDVFPDRFFSFKDVEQLPIRILGEVIEVRKRKLP